MLLTADDPLEGRALKLLLETCGFQAFCLESLHRAHRMLGSDADELLLWVGEHMDAEAVEQARVIRQSCQRVGLCVLANEADAAALRALVSDDAQGFAFLVRSTRPAVDDLVDALRRAADGRSTLDSHALEQLAAPSDPHASFAELSRGEREVLELVALGLRNREIARRLWKSEKTIEKRIGQLFSKLGLHPNAHPHLDRRVVAARMFLSPEPAQPR